MGRSLRSSGHDDILLVWYVSYKRLFCWAGPCGPVGMMTFYLYDTCLIRGCSVVGQVPTVLWAWWHSTIWYVSYKRLFCWAGPYGPVGMMTFYLYDTCLIRGCSVGQVPAVQWAWWHSTIWYVSYKRLFCWAGPCGPVGMMTFYLYDTCLIRGCSVGQVPAVQWAWWHSTCMIRVL